MRFYEFIQGLQRVNKNKVALVKAGVFFYSCGRDAIILEKIFNLKRTCFTKGVCKVGLPVSYVKENILKIKQKLEENNLGIVIYDEMENGNVIFNNKKYGILFEMEGNNIEEKRENKNCINCKNNVYFKREQFKEMVKDNKLNKEKNKEEYTLKREDFILIIQILETVLKSFKKRYELEEKQNEEIKPEKENNINMTENKKED